MRVQRYWLSNLGIEVFIEFEYNSKNFVTYKHDPKLCDILVCWEHDWEGCPIEEVIMLKDAIEQFRE